MAESFQSQHADLTGLAFALYMQQKQQKQQQQGENIEKSQEIFLEQEEFSNLFASAATGTATTNSTPNTTATMEDDYSEELNSVEEKDNDELLINEVRSFRCLWDTKCRGYKDTPKKTQAWKQIAIKLGRTGA